MQELSGNTSVEIGEAEKPSVNFRHLPALDGVLGIAVLVVMIYHLEWLMPSLHDYVKGGFRRYIF